MAKNIKKIKKPKIALVVDVENWAFWNIAVMVSKNLKEYYDFEIISMDTINDDITKLLFYLKNFDLAHFFWRGHLRLINKDNPFIYNLGISYDDFYDMYVKNLNITTSVYDHLFLENKNIINDIIYKCKNYTVSSNKLYNIYSTYPGIIKNPQMVITDGVDLELFKPIKRKSQKKKLVIGWVGNSKWATEFEDYKGFNTIIKPVLNELINKGYPIETCFADRNEKMIPHEQMPEYYSKIDILLCASICEGTPNPVLEAMACGLAVVSTDVGVVPDVFGKNQKKFILSGRNKEELKEKLIMLIENRNIINKLREENLCRIKDWCWRKKCLEFKKFFDSNL